MCKFWSGYMSSDLQFADEFPYESHSQVTQFPPASAPFVALETVEDEAGQIVVDLSAGHPLPGWWSEQHEAALIAHVEGRKAEVAQFAQTKRARKQHAKVLYTLRRMFPDDEQRKRVVDLAGHGSPETALNHIQHVRAERAASRAGDSLDDIKRRCAVAWLEKLGDDYIQAQLDAAQYRCSARTLSADTVRAAIRTAVLDGKRRTVGNWSVANAYYKRGTPTGTYAYILHDLDRPLKIVRATF